jgi:glycosyltransferase involved in cell wall biosynthesis
MLDILIPTCGRPAGLAVTLATLVGQDHGPFRVVVADQSDVPVAGMAELAAVVRVLEAHGASVELVRNWPRRGLAQQRQFLLDRVEAPMALFLDDDLVLEPWVLGQMTRALGHAGCGFVGSAVIGLGHARDHRPHEQAVRFWDGPVEPETLRPDGPAWNRHRLHNAANLWHVQQRLAPDPRRPRLYRVAWVGGCVLYDTAKLRAAGGFDFWRDLPTTHCGEDVLAQLRVMARFGGAGLMPSGVYHQELPTTVPDRRHDAPRLLEHAL